jgi:hypothetical protein
MSAVLTQDVSYLKAYPVGRPFFVRKYLTSVTGVAKGFFYYMARWGGGAASEAA